MEKSYKIREKNVKFALDVYNEARGKSYIIEKELGNGTSAVAYRAVEKGSGKTVVIKAVDTARTEIGCTNSQIIKYTDDEIKALKECAPCKNIIDIIDAFCCVIDEATDERVYLLFLPELEPIKAYFEKNDNSPKAVMEMVKDICKALSFCHSKRILHRDVKPGNIYYSYEKKCFVLADFGVSRAILDPKRAVTVIGSYIAPEIIMNKDLEGRYNSDVYSLGITALVLIQHFSDEKDINKCVKPELLRVILAKAIANDPAIRYLTAADFLKDIQSVEWQEEKPSKFVGTDLETCVTALINGNGRTGKELAEKGHRAGNAKMTCILAYLLSCEDKHEEALSVLEPLRSSGNVTATGLYGAIGRRCALKANDKVKADKYLADIVDTARKGFCISQYFIGRWMIDGQAGFQKNVDEGLRYIFDASKQGFKPAMLYLRKSLRRKTDDFTSVEAMVDLLEISLEDYDESKFYIDAVIAIAES